MPDQTDRLTTIELSKEYLKFSAAHFTVFSATERERLHGHNFRVMAEIEAPVGDNGMCFSYKLYKKKLVELCEELDEFLLLPEYSPHLTIVSEGNQYKVSFADEVMSFLKADTRLLPVRNSTVEEYAHYLLQRFLKTDNDLSRFDIRRIKIKVSSGPGQSGSSEWYCR